MKRSSRSIAIVGMAARLPGARDLEQFWRNLCDGVDSIRVFSPHELAAAGVDAALRAHPLLVPAAGTIDDFDCFDAAFFGYAPRDAALLDPQHRLLLETAWHAVEDAGYDCARLSVPVGVFAGASSVMLGAAAERAGGVVEPAEWHQYVVSKSVDYLAARLSYAMNLRGPSLTVQSACSTSLVAVHYAAQSLLLGECDMALAGAVSLRANPNLNQGYLYQEGMTLSPDGHCRPFDRDACGTVPGDGVAVIVLKRLADAVAAGDSIRAVIRGSAVNNDGSRKVGFTAPSVPGQVQVMRDALRAARLSPRRVGFIEAQGSGTPLGDAIEVEAMQQVYGAGRGRRSCVVGSVKSNIGNTWTVAGLAGLAKATLALQHGKIPPTLHFKAPLADSNLEAGPLFVNTHTEAWPARNGRERVAAVSASGIGGTNAHLILEEPPVPASRPQPPGPHLLLLSARTPAQLVDCQHALAAWLEAHADIALADVAYTLALGRKQFRHRAFWCVADRAAALRVLREPCQATLAPERLRAEVHADRDAHALGRAWLAGEAIDWERYYHGRGLRRVPLPTYPFERRRFAVEGLSRAPRRETLDAGDADKVIADMCCELLGLDAIGPQDDLVELGAHSLTATRLIARLHERFNVQLPLRSVLASRSVAQLAALVSTVRGAGLEGLSGEREEMTL